MKYTFFLILIIFNLTVQVNTLYSQDNSVLDKKITINIQNVTLERALRKISKISDVNFAYCNDIINLSEKISLNVNQEPLKITLDKLFKGTGINYMVINNLIALQIKNDIAKIEKKEVAPENKNRMEIKTDLTDLAEISKNPKLYENKKIIITGVYLGYSGSECKFLENICSISPVTRSDWIFSDDKNCIYVTGGKHGSYNPMDKQFKDKKIELFAIVKKNTDEKLYLYYINSIIIN